MRNSNIFNFLYFVCFSVKSACALVCFVFVRVCVWYLTQMITCIHKSHGCHFSLAPMHGYLGQAVILANISVYCWVQIKLLLLLLMMLGQSRVLTARQGITLLKPDSPLWVWILNALGCKKFKIVNKPGRNLTLEKGDWRDIVPARRFYSIFEFLWNKILIIIRRTFIIILWKLNAIIMIFEII